MNFIHLSVRLNTSITQSMRSFLIEKEVEKWLGTNVSIENKVGGSYNIKVVFENVEFESKSIILNKEFEKLIKLEFDIPKEYMIENKKSIVDINFMQCAEETEYCTEIHILHKGVENEFFKRFWNQKLNILRKKYNGDWVIEDRELNLSMLKGSKL